MEQDGFRKMYTIQESFLKCNGPKEHNKSVINSKVEKEIRTKTVVV